MTAFFVVKHHFAKGAAKLRFAHARGTQEDERADGALGVLQARAGAAKGAADGADGLVLPHDAAVQQLLHVEQPLAFVLGHLFHRDARPARHDLCDVLVGDHFMAVVLALLPGGALAGDVLTELALLVAQAGRLTLDRVLR